MNDDANAMVTINIRAFRSAFRGIVSDKYLADMDSDRRADMLGRRTAKKNLPGFKCFVAESVAGIVGFISTHATRDEDQDSDRIGEVGAIYVRPDLWGRGVGQMLMKLGIEALKASGFSTATLWTLRDADQARRFYEAGGWQLDGADKDLLLDAPVALIRYRVSLADF